MSIQAYTIYGVYICSKYYIYFSTTNSIFSFRYSRQPNRTVPHCFDSSFAFSLHSPCICRFSATHISHTKYHILIPYTSLLFRHLPLLCFLSVICCCHTFSRYFPLPYFFSIRKMLCKSSALSSFGSSNSALSRKVKSHISRFSLLV